MLFKFQTLACFILIALHVHSKPHIEAKSREEIEHFADDPERHDVNFDHTAFLGSEAAKEYAHLTPEQSRRKLKEIVRKIDKDEDGKVSPDELKKWIAHIATVSQQQVTDNRWAGLNPTGIDPLPWKVYIENSYGKEEDRMKDSANVEEYKRIVGQEKRRWDAADQNADGALSKEEFFDFLNPEDKVHMKAAIIEELLDSVDFDKNGLVSEKEYLNDIARAYQTPLNEGGPEPSWVAREREQFRTYRDLDHDGQMDRREIGEWIMPTGYDPVEAETQHLFYHADSDNDGVLTEAEILNRQDLFVSSQATNYGIELERREEL
ncbi:Reticulocalbin 3 EF-hand calcium binding domain [Paragonimus heterotremus]|uniref:Reticulocalbin-3 n=1 Tax=Paragonimus heterotremus TaxID=100268 RepID=A0A8J4SRJ1_9TREM|nr:Reticulocalbin 3 EF-hand calcium binding domain [Paragonimus heterotremus]